MGKSKIEWTERTWNPIVGCSIVSPGCTHCYAMRQADRIERMAISSPFSHYFGVTKVANGNPVWTGTLALAPEKIETAPLRRRKPTTWCVNSMGDLFHESVPDAWIDRVFAIMGRCPQHTFQILTKRSGRMRAYVTDPRTPHRIARAVLDLVIERKAPISNGDDWPVASEGPVDQPNDVTLKRWPLPNVWKGVSAEDQQRADERIPHLLATPAAVRFVSCEPLLGPITLPRVNFHCELCGGTGILARWPKGKCHECGGRGEIRAISTDPKYGTPSTPMRRIDWVIAGGESGPRARPMHTAWARSLRDQCAASAVPFFFKQHGEWLNWFYFGDAGIEDDEEVTRYETCIWDDDHFEMIGRPIWSDLSDFYGGGPDTIDDPDQVFGRVGKARSGCLLDGREHKDFPVI